MRAGLPQADATSPMQPKLIGVVDRDHRAALDAEFEQGSGLDRGGDDDVLGGYASVEHLLEFPFARDIDAMSKAHGLVDKRQRLVRLAGEEEPHLDIARCRGVRQLGGVACQRFRIDQVDGGPVLRHPSREAVGIGGQDFVPSLKAPSERHDAFAHRAHARSCATALSTTRRAHRSGCV